LVVVRDCDGNREWSRCRDRQFDCQLYLMSPAIKHTPTAKGNGFSQLFTHDLACFGESMVKGASDIFSEYRINVVSFLISFNKVRGFRISVPSCRSSNGSREPMETANDIAYSLKRIFVGCPFGSCNVCFAGWTCGSSMKILSQDIEKLKKQPSIIRTVLVAEPSIQRGSWRCKDAYICSPVVETGKLFLGSLISKDRTREKLMECPKTRVGRVDEGLGAHGK
jgi:hypothetical protein